MLHLFDPSELLRRVRSWLGALQRTERVSRVTEDRTRKPKPTMTVSIPHLQWLTRKELDAILAIEEESFDFPWDQEEFLRVMRMTSVAGKVVLIDRRVVAYMIYELHPNRLHLINFAVAFRCRRQGVGKYMIDRLKGTLSHDRRRRIMLEVSDHNLDGQLFFRAMGFKAISVLKGFYPNHDNDAYLFQYRLESESKVSS